MSNPVVSVTNSIPVPSDPSIVRKTYTMKTFCNENFFSYKLGGYVGFDPSKLGHESYFWDLLDDSLKGLTPPPVPLPPAFVAGTETLGPWSILRLTPSGFITPNNSIMPKIMTPSILLVDNSVYMDSKRYSSVWYEPGGSSPLYLFNWILDTQTTDTGTIAILEDAWWWYAQAGGNFGSQYVSFKAKEDDSSKNILTFHMVQPDLPSPIPDAWEFETENLVGGGAFVLMINVLGITPGKISPEIVAQQRWSLKFTFGDVTMMIKDTGPMTVSITGDPSGPIETNVNLAEGMAKEGPPQQQHMADKHPIIIGVYPCWNGIVVSSGEQESKQVYATASTYCKKFNAVTIKDVEYTPDWFDPQSPDNVEVGIGDTRVAKVNFGDRIDVVADNCRFEIAYLPRFFSQDMSFDTWLLLNTDTDDVSYDYNVYTIWTANGTDYELDLPINLTDSGVSGEVEGTSYFSANWEFYTPGGIFLRRSGEIFAYILETVETMTFSIKNGNGNFDLEWSGGTPGSSSSSDWVDFIRSLSVTIGIDGSSGSITVDKYGVAGQEAVAIQKIGAIVLSATGGVGTHAGEIFSGLAMGVSHSEQTSDSTWTIPLIGLEKKLDDISLINPPFMDGETLGVAMDFLCRYAGIIHSFVDGGSPGISLSATQEINSARFDWKSGTSVKTAIDDVMGDVNHGYVIYDGVLHIYAKDNNGLPVTLGPDMASGRSLKSMVSLDRAPDFEDLRNYVVGMALQQVPEGQGTEIAKIQTYPMLEARTKSTTPDVPWAKCWVAVYPGFLTPDSLEDIVDKMSKMSSVYEVLGNLTIPGDARIKPFDTWVESGTTYVIYSVTHNIDLQAKTWTTSLEFMRAGV